MTNPIWNERYSDTTVYTREYHLVVPTDTETLRRAIEILPTHLRHHGIRLHHVVGGLAGGATTSPAPRVALHTLATVTGHGYALTLAAGIGATVVDSETGEIVWTPVGGHAGPAAEAARALGTVPATVHFDSAFSGDATGTSASVRIELPERMDHEEVLARVRAAFTPLSPVVWTGHDEPEVA